MFDVGQGSWVGAPEEKGVRGLWGRACFVLAFVAATQLQLWSKLAVTVVCVFRGIVRQRKSDSGK